MSTATLFGKLRNFGSVTGPGTVAKYLSEDRDTACPKMVVRFNEMNGMGEGPNRVAWLCYVP